MGQFFSLKDPGSTDPIESGSYNISARKIPVPTTQPVAKKINNNSNMKFIRRYTHRHNNKKIKTETISCSYLSDRLKSTHHNWDLSEYYTKYFFVNLPSIQRKSQRGGGFLPAISRNNITSHVHACSFTFVSICTLSSCGTKQKFQQ